MNSTSLKLGLQSSLTRIPASWVLGLTIGPTLVPSLSTFYAGHSITDFPGSQASRH